LDAELREVISMADDVGIVVMVEEGKREHLDQVAKALEEKGMRVETKLPRFRTIVGSGDRALLEKLKSTDGVETVRQEQRYQLPPMNEKVPQ
jgi:hypothetical protein